MIEDELEEIIELNDKQETLESEKIKVKPISNSYHSRSRTTTKVMDESQMKQLMEQEQQLDPELGMQRKLENEAKYHEKLNKAICLMSMM